MSFTSERKAQLETLMAKADVDSRFGKYNGNKDLDLLNGILSTLGADSDNDGKEDWKNNYYFNSEGSNVNDYRNGVNPDYLGSGIPANSSFVNSLDKAGFYGDNTGTGSAAYGITQALKFFKDNNFKNYKEEADKNTAFYDDKYSNLNDDILAYHNTDINKDYTSALGETQAVLAGRGLSNSAILARLENKLNERKDNNVSKAINLASNAVQGEKDYARQTHSGLVKQITDGFGADIDVNAETNRMNTRLNQASSNNTAGSIGSVMDGFTDLNNYRKYNNGVSNAFSANNKNNSTNYFNNDGYNGRVSS